MAVARFIPTSQVRVHPKLRTLTANACSPMGMALDGSREGGVIFNGDYTLCNGSCLWTLLFLGARCEGRPPSPFHLQADRWALTTLEHNR